MTIHNAYKADLIFIMCYLINKRFSCWFENKQHRWMPEFCGFFFWSECFIFLMYLFKVPAHTESEKLVSFCMMLFTIIVYRIIDKKNILQ